MSSLINQSLNIVHNQLASFSLSSGFWEAIDTAFGTAYNREVTDEVRSLWQSGDFSQLPEVEIVDSSVLGNADGSYGTTTNKIYLSSEFVTNATLSDVAKVVLEEVGHFLDAQINQKDSPGDEGAIFAELVQGNSLDSVALDLLRAESDLSKITLHGQLIDVEQSDNLSLPGVDDSSVAWADYDGDGDQDFLLTGFSNDDFSGIAKLYKNTGSGFKEDTSVSLPGVDYSSVAWADYDGDGDQDFLLTGFSKDGRIAKLYKNTGSGFKEDTSVSLPGVDYSSVAWADYDGDGDQDFL
ncbi:MAG: VCBS repeat-containing protein, partial [Cylindrospermopsis raciborskii PAMP2012]|uniref:FG-GAP repeat domain-containing protein n=1 Tax=Cylindrospermopsis raciborskii TaxID=77022 RepID=UPI0022C9EAA4